VNGVKASFGSSWKNGSLNMQSFSKWLKGIRGKLLTMVLFPVGIIGGLYFTASSGLQAENKVIDELVLQRLPITREIGSLQFQLNASMRLFFRALLTD
jgi:hypothetical protein